MNKRTPHGAKAIELERVDCVGRGDYSNLKHLLLEGVSPSVLDGSLLLAAKYGDRVFKSTSQADEKAADDA